MDHPNAIYFYVAAQVFMMFLGGMYLAGAFGVGTFGDKAKFPGIPKALTTKAFKGTLGALLLVLNGYATFTDIQKFISP